MFDVEGDSPDLHAILHQATGWPRVHAAAFCGEFEPWEPAAHGIGGHTWRVYAATSLLAVAGVALAVLVFRSWLAFVRAPSWVLALQATVALILVVCLRLVNGERQRRAATQPPAATPSSGR